MGTLESGIMFGTLFIYIAVGIWVSRRVKSSQDFLIASRSLGSLVLTGTFIATYYSAITMLGYPANAYNNGIACLWYPIFWAGGAGVWMVLMAYGLKKRYPHLTTPADFFKARYNSPRLELFVAIASVFAQCINLIVQFRAMGIAWSLTLGRAFEEGVIIAGITILIILVSGGMVSVAYTDVIKAIIFIVAVTIPGIWTVTHYNGVGAILNAAAKVDPKLTDPGSFTALSILTIFLVWSLGTASRPQYPQRALAAKDMRTAMTQYIVSFPILAILYIFLAIMGLQARVLMPALPAGVPVDYALPMYFRQYAPTVFYALFLVGIVAAGLSTTDSILQIAASTFTVNVVKYFKEFPSHIELKVARIVSFTLAIIVTVLSIRPLPTILTLGGYSAGILAIGYFAPIMFGIYWRKGNRVGAEASVGVGLVTFIIAQTLSILRRWPYANMPPLALAIIIAIVTYIVGSLIGATRNEKVISE